MCSSTNAAKNFRSEVSHRRKDFRHQDRLKFDGQPILRFASDSCHEEARQADDLFSLKDTGKDFIQFSLPLFPRETFGESSGILASGGILCF